VLKGLLKIEKIQDTISKVKKLAEDKIAKNENADEFVEIAEADDFKIYVAKSTLLQEKPSQNPQLERCLKAQETFSC